MAAGYQNRLLLLNVSQKVAGHVGLIAEVDDDCIGFAAGHITTVSDVLAVPFVQIETDCPLGPLETVGYIDIVCVNESYQNRGIGTELLTRVVSKLQTDDVPLVTEVWHRDGIDGGDVLEKVGFEAVATLHDYWTYTTAGCDPCPECGRSPCECSGSLFIQHGDSELLTASGE